MTKVLQSILFSCCLLLVSFVYGQDTGSGTVVDRYLSAVERKSRFLENRLDKGQQQYLRKLQKTEQKILRKLQMGKDTALASTYAHQLQTEYVEMEHRLDTYQNGLQAYDAEIDSLRTNLGFIRNYLPGKEAFINQNIGHLSDLENQLQKNQYLEDFIGFRTASVKSLLGENTFLKPFQKELKALNKVKYYYSSQLNEYKSYLKDKKKAEQKLLSVFRQSSLYEQFVQKNSWFARLFPTAGQDASAVDLSQLGNLQTRSQLSTLLQNQLSVGGENALQSFQQQLGEAQQQVSQLQNRVFEGMGNGDPDFPSFKPNHQKSKSLLDRLTIGFDIQNSRANQWFPITSDYGISVGYKLNDQSIVGLGASAKIGWGENLRNIQLSYQGHNVRSFLEYKIKGNLWVYGGYELNYRVMVAGLENHRTAEPVSSALLGLSKKLPIKSSFLKQTRVQILYDFLNHHQYANRLPLVFRMSFGN